MSWNDFESGAKNPHYGCKVCRYIKSLNKSEAKAFQAVLDNPAFSTRQIWLGLKARKVKVSAEYLGIHRRGECGGDE